MSGTAIAEVIELKSTLRREFVIRLKPDARIIFDAIATKYALTTPEGLPRDAEIARVLLVCALAESRTPREKAAIALFVNGLMQVSQVLWLGLYDVRDDLTAVMRKVVGFGRASEKAVKRGSRQDRHRVHVKIDDWLHSELSSISRGGGDGKILVETLVNGTVTRPDMYETVFESYSRGIASVRQGLVNGMTTVRDALRSAVVVTLNG